ncbi:flavodoxin reductase [Pseudoflavitalea sp. G-6-1-2]|uniref:FAD-binding oxidoreductase n=1 Tax=Pseudoflavitalea sp. G-6-1-2 TaxID=2728841 RepID=UPI00146BF92C|nr:FAD-binding oxidoreductase [Pseudoflavitalea sp. G-6-1-2]NML22066.1 flavodoxin reductase [Pseudoflavitalea sp. G-6-1-2]
MEKHIVEILSIKEVTHDVKSFRFRKPQGYRFNPGQATEVSVNKPGWEDERRPFTFTSLNDEPTLEFTIKRYSDHKGVTDKIHQLVPGDQLIIRDVWGAIEYNGPGYFIAGGAGITPFIAILRQLKRDGQTAGNVLFFSNKTAFDVILEKELYDILGSDAHFILTKNDTPGYEHGYINKAFLDSNATNLSKRFYVCGPDKMIKDVTGALEQMGVEPDAVVFEK